MATGRPAQIPIPLSSTPGFNPQESAGRLINAYAEPIGGPNESSGPARYKWIRSAGLSQHAATAQSGYRGGLAVNNYSYNAWSGNCSYVDSSGSVTSIGAFPGTKKVSIARNNASPTPDVVAVDVDNGAYVLESASVNAATATATINTTDSSGNAIPFNAGDIVDLTILNAFLDDFPVTVSYTVQAGDTATNVATGLKNAINANTALSNAKVSATSLTNVITLSHLGSIGNLTSMLYTVGGTETPTATNIGTNTSTSGATCALTNVNVPAGSIIVLCAAETSAEVGTVLDSVNGSYTLAAFEQFNTSADAAGVFYFPKSAALPAFYLPTLWADHVVSDCRIHTP